MAASRAVGMVLGLAIASASWPVAAGSDAPAAALQKAANCRARLNHFGRIDGGYTPADGRMQMRNDGGWCWILVSWRWYGVKATPSGSSETPPTHGTIQFDTVVDQLRIAYRPTGGFAGDDSFEVKVVGPGNIFTVPVHVQVNP